MLAVRGVSWEELLATARQARPEYFALCYIVGSGSYFLRGWRWRILLSAEKPLPRLMVFWATMAGYLGNSYLPARAGELIRSVFLGRRAEVSATFVLATALTERIVDAVVLVLIGAASLLALPGRAQALAGSTRAVALVGLLGLASVLAAPHLESQLKQVIGRLPLSARWRSRLADLLNQFLLGMRALQHRRRAASFLALTAVIWLADALNVMLAARSLRLAVTLPQALLLLATLGLASAVPITPGGIGVFQFVAVTVLVPLGFSRGQALLLITLTQAIGYAIVTLWGLIGLWRLAGAPYHSRRPSEMGDPGAGG